MVWRGIEDARALGYACSLAHGLLMGSLWHSELARCHSFCLRMPAGNPISVVVPKKLVAAEPPIDPTGQPQHNYWTKNGMPYSTKTAMSAANITKAASPANVRTRPAAAGMLCNRFIGSSALGGALDRNCWDAAARRRLHSLIRN